MRGRNYYPAIQWRGREWPVSPEFYADTIEPFPELEVAGRDEIKAEMWRLLDLSEQQALTEGERHRLDAYTRSFNLRNAIVFLGNRSLTEFGFLYYDQVHGQRGTYQCGCQLHYVFDHYLGLAIASGAPPQRVYNGITDLVLHPIEPRSVCAKHKHLSHDLAALAEAVHREAAEWVPQSEVQH